MKKIFTTLAVAFCTILATAQTNQYFWLNGNLMFGNAIVQTDSLTFSDIADIDTLHLFLPRTIVKTIYDTITITETVHDTVYVNNCDPENQLPEGALPGEFSVSPTKKVRFSKGNLQYNAALGTHQCADGTTQQGTWRFAEHQWDTLGMSQNQKSILYAGWIGAFAWGTSGWNSGAINYQPWDVSANDNQNYYVGGNMNNDLTGIYEYADWGVYNAISNGGNQPNLWRTLTKNEWEYILSNRTNASKLCSYAFINGIEGMIILPDNYIFPKDISFIPSPKNNTENNYSMSEWYEMEAAGAIFLPNDVGYSFSKQNTGWGYLGNVYWSTTHLNNEQSFAIYLPTLNIYSLRYRCDSGFVRLVQDVE